MMDIVIWLVKFWKEEQIEEFFSLRSYFLLNWCLSNINIYDYLINLNQRKTFHYGQKLDVTANQSEFYSASMLCDHKWLFQTFTSLKNSILHLGLGLPQKIYAACYNFVLFVLSDFNRKITHSWLKCIVNPLLFSIPTYFLS